MRGLLLKLDAFRNIQTPSRDEEDHTAWARPSTQGCVYRGRQPLTTSQVLAEYNTLRLSERYVATNLHHLYDLFSQPEACLVADTIQHLTDVNADFDPALVVSDVSSAIGSIHISGLLHRSIAADIGRYLKPNPAIAQLMRRLRAHGKRTFLLTNSSFEFVDAGMQAGSPLPSDSGSVRTPGWQWRSGGGSRGHALILTRVGVRAAATHLAGFPRRRG
jgi:hypothetical protein